MSRTLDTRLSRLEAQQPAAAVDPPYRPPMPSEAWWTELCMLLDASPYLDVIMAALAVEEGERAC